MSAPGLDAAAAEQTRAAAALPPEWAAEWRAERPQGGTWDDPTGAVDSIQWIDVPSPGRFDLARLERLYFAWVPRLVSGMVRPQPHADGSLSLGVVPFHRPRLIRMAPAEREDDGSVERRVRPILGGVLANPGGALCFEQRRRAEGLRLVVAVRGLSPRLPRWLYHGTQAGLHERSTFAFLREVSGPRRAALLGEGR